MKKIKKEKISFQGGSIREMSDDVDSSKLKVEFASDVDIDKLTEGDDDPLFVIVEVMNPQISKNGTRWTNEVMADIARQINENKPDAYMGHLRDEDRAFDSPESQTLWLGASIVEIDGKPRLLAKGYVLPYAENLKKYLKAATLLKKDFGVSVYGLASQQWNESLGAWDIEDFILESIDWARTGAKGTYDTKLLKLTKEQEDNMSTKEEIIAELNEGDLKKYNPDLHAKVAKKIEDGKKEDEATKEMEKINKALEATITEQKKEIAKGIESHVTSELNEKVKNEGARGFIQKMVMSELKSDDTTRELADKAIKSVLESDAGKSLLVEMSKSKKVTVQEAKKKEGEFEGYLEY